jgi:catechol 2,3-dioxygenase-like lactoylglutathione lyase family enzyme
MDMKIELLSVPVADIDRAKEFYVKAGFNADHDITVSDEIRFVQLTPPGSACSIVLDLNFSPMAPGSQKGIQCVVASADEALAYLRERGIEASDVDEQSWGRFVYFDDVDGNGWALQELPARG